MASIFEIFLLCSVFLDVVQCYPFSASRQECKDLIPTAIRARPQSSNIKPFKLTVVDTIFYDEPLGVTIEINGTYPIKGIMIQARRTGCDHINQSIPLGKFVEPIDPAFKVVNCSGYADTVINRSWMPIKRNIEIKWTSNTYRGTMFFIATVVSTDKLYWTDITSQPARHYSDQSKDTERCPSSNLYKSGNNACGVCIQFTLLLAICIWNFMYIFMYF